MTGLFRAVAFTLLVATFWIGGLPQARAAACPELVDPGDCVANDLQPSGTEVVEGPTACTSGEVISLTVRVRFDNGGGANERYSVGFFVGDNGQPPIGGESCTFDSLRPVGEPVDLTGGNGGFLELNGDQCGDLSRSDATYKDIQLDKVLCKDDDGDGQIDIGYVLTWVNNGNQADCQDPNDPLEFEASPPKCQADLDYDLPIEVEQPPTMQVAKAALPNLVEEPGGEVNYAITIINTSPSGDDPLEVYSIIDDPYGDITALTDCTLPLILAHGESVTCKFITGVTGTQGEIITDMVTVHARDNEGEEVSASHQAQVTISGAAEILPPGDLRMAKFATPSQIPEPGSTVQYVVLVANVSPTPVLLKTLEDDLYGNLNGKGNCVLPQSLEGASSIYFCTFQEMVSGKPGDVVTDIISASGTDESGSLNVLTADATASVEIYNLGSEIEVTKVPDVKYVYEPGGTVTYSIQVQNQSAVDEVTITQLLDSRELTDLGDCKVPFTLKPGGETYACSFTGEIEANAGEIWTNSFVAAGIDDDGLPVADRTAASVFVIGTKPTIEVEKLALPPLAAAAGSDVRYVVIIKNTASSADPVTITSLVDEIDGVQMNLDGVGTCDLDLDGIGLVLEPTGYYVCSWVVNGVTGTEGVPLVDTVTATGTDDEGTPVEASDSATVNFIEIAPGIAQMNLLKFASPVEVPEPGADVTYTVAVANTSDQGDLDLTLTVESLEDDLYGSLNGKGDCAVPFDLAVGEFYICQFTEAVSGPINTDIVDIVTATATYRNDQRIMASDDAKVTITDVPSSIAVFKSADPTAVTEPGADVDFTVKVSNNSGIDTVTIGSLTDNVHGDLNGLGSCVTPQDLAPGESFECSFTAYVGGEPGTHEVNTVVAIGVDDDGMAVQNQDQAEVGIVDAPASMNLKKTADPRQLPAEGGPVSFIFTTANSSAVDTIELETLVDSQFGDLNGKGTCSVPQTLAPLAIYECVFETELPPNPGGTHFNTARAQGLSDDGVSLTARAAAIVNYLEELIPIPALGQLGLALLVLLLGWAGVAVIRARD